MQVKEGIQNDFYLLQIYAEYLNQSRKQITDFKKEN